MNEQIVIKYKEETLLKSEMTEREKAIWEDGYKQGRHGDSMLQIIIGISCIILFAIIDYCFKLYNQ